MGLKGLAEGIILQSIEDLWDEEEREHCISFFRSRDFGICAEVAGIDVSDQLKVLTMVKGIIANSSLPERVNRSRKAEQIAEGPGAHSFNTLL